MMETIKGIFELIKIRGCDGITAHNVTKIKKCRQAFDDSGRDMSCDSTKVYLCSKTMSSESEKLS
jgi:hypothetical protein